MFRNSSVTSGAPSFAGLSASPAFLKRPGMQSLPDHSMRSFFFTRRRSSSCGGSSLTRPTTGKPPTPSMSVGFRPTRARQPTASSLRMRSCIVSVIGRSWPRSSEPQDSPPASAATCSSALLWSRTRHGGRFLILREAGAAQHRPPLRRFEWNRRLFAAFRTRRARFCPHTGPARAALCLALFAALRVVHELFVVEKNLLAGGEDKLRPAVDTR
jgi:hypothetical protein